MKAGRVSRSVRQWGNFSFLVALLLFVGWYSYKKSLEKVLEIPDGYVQLVSETTGFLFFKRVHESVREPGEYPLTAKELLNLEKGEIQCVPIGPRTFEVSGVVDTSSMMQGLSAKIGIGHKTFVEFDGTLTIDTDKDSVRKVVAQEFPKTLQESVQHAAQKAAGLLRTKQDEASEGSIENSVHPFSTEVAKRVQETLNISAISFSLRAHKEVDTGSVGVSIAPTNGAAVVPKVHEEMPVQGYFSIAFVLFCTVFVYALVRVLLGELFGILFVIFIGIPLSAFGFVNLRLYEPGHYENRRRRRASSAAEDVATGLAETVYNTESVAGDLVSSIHSHHAGGGVVDSVGDAVSSLGDAADVMGGIGEAAGSLFDGLGALGDLF